ncbi:4'-phosphopantetheinyl transferase family protein [Kordia zhangzhouensis]|uniref:4'-phosphopantetheinyl transferase family protein n=1 Tax=Kordia zhangzhouensis TaxID=1620405 RepID=UPI0006290900|nr:4'-phosphopantetheinyl transferase superfamily protein [Kordia zhangzhouensis]
MIHIFYAYTSEKDHNALLCKYLPVLPPSYREKILRFRNWKDAQLSLLGRLLLDHGIKTKFPQYADSMEIAYTSHRKPYFKNNNLKFNISHSKNMAICVISDGADMGIDVEGNAPVNIDDFKEYMTPFEWQQVISAPKKENAFYKYWTKKEAVIKADGRGLSIPLKSFEVKEEIANIENSAYVLKEVFLDSEYTCYIALKKQKNIATQPQFDEKVVLNQVHISSEMKVAMV